MLSNGFSRKAAAPAHIASDLANLSADIMIDRSGCVRRMQRPEHLEAIDTGHLNVEQHDVRRRALKECKAGLGCGRPHDVVPFVTLRAIRSELRMAGSSSMMRIRM